MIQKLNCAILFQAHPDDPPYLTVGTEVSAKYRGAFCEATIKIAERLVKCKVSFSFESSLEIHLLLVFML